MKKVLQLFMFVTIIGSQFTGIVSNISLYASEVQSLDEETSDIDEHANSNANSETESDIVSQEVSSEQVSSQTTDSSSDVAIETTSDDEGEALSEANSETASTEVSRDDSSATDNIDAKISIDEDGALKSKQAAVPTAFKDDTQLEENENITTYQNELRLDANSGESSINIDLTSKSRSLTDELTDKKVYFTLDEDGTLSNGTTKQPKSYNGNLITVLNGTIIDSDNAIIRTSGGYNETFYIYDSIADLKSNTDGIPISGGGFDGTFIETVKSDGKYYTHLKISGYEGYTEAGNVQIIPEELMQARSYYTNEDGSWVYYSAIDPVTSTAYDTMAIGVAPASAEVGVKYYTDDDVTYYTDEIIDTSVSSSISYNSYFQNLPFRSVSNYTASNYKSYLKAKGKTDSEYYNETTAFTDAQNKESVNSLLIFAMANHESAYGLSTYAKECNNFFGRGAYDSNPDNACDGYDYPTATDGILAQTLFLQNGYFDILDWRYSGTHVGNKASGINVKYASDTDWGKKISNHAYMIDQYLGGKEENKYAIAKVSGKKYVYTNSKLSTNVKSSGDTESLSTYDLSQIAGTSNTVNVVALKQENGSYQIYVPTAVKQSSSSDCSFTDSMGGKYPNYGGRSKVSVATNTANYSCDYESFTKQKYWISKSNTSIINDKSVPYTTHTVKTYDDNGNLKFSFVVNNSNDVIRFAYRYDTKGNIVRKYVYQDGTVYGDSHWNKYKTVYDVNNGQVTKAQSYTTAQNVQYIYTYYDGATLSNNTSYMKNRFDLDPKTGYILQANAYTKGANRKRKAVYVYNDKTKYGNHPANIKWRFDLDTSNGDIAQCFQYIDGAGSGFNKVYTYQDGTKYGSAGTKAYRDVFWLKNTNMEIDYAIRYVNGEKYKHYTYDEGTRWGVDKLSDHIKETYYY